MSGCPYQRPPKAFCSVYRCSGTHDSGGGLCYKHIRKRADYEGCVVYQRARAEAAEKDADDLAAALERVLGIYGSDIGRAALRAHDERKKGK